MVYLEKLKFVRYLLVGGLNTVFGYCIYSIFVFSGVGYSQSLLIATISGVFFNYITFSKVVFNSSHKWIVLAKFIVCYVVVYFLNVTLLTFFINDMEIDPYISQVLCLTPMVILNWSLFKYWVYK
ncbi:GtrA family protein [Vibrio genomosp. F10 str. 9ZC157]|nr:GtrA family protein [Vibrio genomosp. F10]